MNVTDKNSADFSLASVPHWMGSSLYGGMPPAKKRRKSPPAPELSESRPKGKRIAATVPLSGWLLFRAWGCARLQCLRAFDSCLSPAT